MTKYICIILVASLAIGATVALILRPLKPLTPAEQYALQIDKARKNCVNNGHGVLVADKNGKYACGIIKEKAE